MAIVRRSTRRLSTFREWLVDHKGKSAAAISTLGAQRQIRKPAAKAGKMLRESGAKGSDRAT